MMLLIWLSVAACGDHREPAGAPEVPETQRGSGAHGLITIAPDMMRDLRVTLGKVEARASGETVAALGELHVNEDAYAEIAAPVSARVKKILAKPGDIVTAGQVLVQLDSPELGESRAAVDAAHARVGIARKNAERKRALAAERLIPDREVVEAETAVTEAEAAANVAGAGLRKYGPAGETSLAIKSPIGGTVIDRTVVMGQLADPSKTLFRVGDLSMLWLVVHVFERDAVRVAVDRHATATFAALPAKTTDAVIRAIGREVDAASRTIAIRLDVPNPEGVLRPGMSATASIPLGDRTDAPVLVVPAASVQRFGEGWVVFVPHGPNAFEARAIGRGRDLAGEVEVLSGLKAGDPLVIDGAFLLKAEADKGHE